jgi:hypothetical protein
MNIPNGVATPGKCVLVPPCAAYLSPTFFTPGVSNMLLKHNVSFVTNAPKSNCLLHRSDLLGGSREHVCSSNNGASAEGDVTGVKSGHVEL